MIEFFANSILEHVKEKTIQDECKYTLSNDSQNAICYTGESFIVYWHLSANLENNMFELKDVKVDKKTLDLIYERVTMYPSVSEALNLIINLEVL